VDDDAVWLLEIELLSSDEDEDDVDENRVELELEAARDDEDDVEDESPVLVLELLPSDKDENVDVGSKELEIVEEYEELELDCVVLTLALAGIEEAVDDEDDSLELEVSEELELDCATLGIAEEEVSVEEGSLVELESEDSVLEVDVLVLSIEDEAAELVCVELPDALDDVEEAGTFEELLLDSDDDDWNEPANAVEDEDSVELARTVEMELDSVLLALALACVVDVEDSELEAEPLELGRLELGATEIVLLDAAALKDTLLEIAAELVSLLAEELDKAAF
jgi:hypothetical protein